MNFTKQDLKPSMIVETREGGTYEIMIGDDDDLCAVRREGYFFLANLRDDLTSMWDIAHNIVKVWEAPTSRTLDNVLTTKGPLLYERKEESKKYLVIHSFESRGTKVKQGEILTLLELCELTLYNEYQTSKGSAVTTSLDNLVELED